MRINKTFLSILIGIAIGAMFFAAYMLISTHVNDTSFSATANAVDLSIGIISFIISGVAIILSLVTYFSIDAVNALSSMEGNVLCNEHYNAEYSLLVNEFKDCESAEALENKIHNTIMESLSFYPKTCMEFTDSIQKILDHILWYAYVTKTENFSTDVEIMVKRLDSSYQKFTAISNGNQYLLKEHIKLIKNVLNYQSISHGEKSIRDKGEILDVRGRLFLNPVSKTIYYDYLGLEFYKKAVDFIKKEGQIEESSWNEFTLENMNRIHSILKKFNIDKKTELSMYLEKARDAYHHASIASENDILWNGYISFNIARVDLLTSIINEKLTDDWDKSIRAAIYARFTVLKLFVNEDSLKKTPENKTSYLFSQLKKEYYYSKSLHLILRAYHEQNELVDIKQEALALKELLAVEGLIELSIFDKTREYLNSIIEYKS